MYMCMYICMYVLDIAEYCKIGRYLSMYQIRLAGDAYVHNSM